MHLEGGQEFCIKENQNAYLFLPSFFFFPSLAPKNAYGKFPSMSLRILKFITKVRYGQFKRVLEIHAYIAYQSLYMSIFLSLRQKYVLQIPQYCVRAGQLHSANCSLMYVDYDRGYVSFAYSLLYFILSVFSHIMFRT